MSTSLFLLVSGQTVLRLEGSASDGSRRKLAPVMFEGDQLVVETGGGVEMWGRKKRGWNGSIVNTSSTCGILNGKEINTCNYFNSISSHEENGWEQINACTPCAEVGSG